jgi:hypothetical protein
MNSQQKSPEPDVPGYLNQGITDLPGTVPGPKVKSVKPIDCHRYRHYLSKKNKSRQLNVATHLKDSVIRMLHQANPAKPIKKCQC